MGGKWRCFDDAPERPDAARARWTGVMDGTESGRPVKAAPASRITVGWLA
jgi:hypothetical protein